MTTLRDLEKYDEVRHVGAPDAVAINDGAELREEVLRCRRTKHVARVRLQGRHSLSAARRASRTAVRDAVRASTLGTLMDFSTARSERHR